MPHTFCNAILSIIAGSNTIVLYGEANHHSPSSNQSQTAASVNSSKPFSKFIALNKGMIPDNPFSNRCLKFFSHWEGQNILIRSGIFHAFPKHSFQTQTKPSPISSIRLGKIIIYFSNGIRKDTVVPFPISLETCSPFP